MARRRLVLLVAEFRSSDQETDFGQRECQQKVHVRMVESVEESAWIVLDSGADVSLLPYRCLVGQDTPSPNLQLEDAQGNSLAVGGMKQAQVEFEHCLNDKTGCCISESFVHHQNYPFFWPHSENRMDFW